MPSHATDYAAWDAFEDSDDERKKEEAAAKKAKADEAKARAKARADAAAASGNIDGLPEGMSRDEFMKAYSKVINPNGSKKPYKFPDTAPEQDAICTAAADLKKRGNELYAKGEYVEAAKLYEQAVLKFSDWYAEAFAGEDERARVLPIKLPSHLNLAACSWRLGNHEHAVLHCTQARLRCPPPLHTPRRTSTRAPQVLDHEPSNPKALYRRGSSRLALGYLDEAMADLRAAAAAAPNDAEIRRELRRCREKRREYRGRTKQISVRMVASAESLPDGPSAPSDAPGDAPDAAPENDAQAQIERQVAAARADPVWRTESSDRATAGAQIGDASTSVVAEPSRVAELRSRWGIEDETANAQPAAGGVADGAADGMAGGAVGGATPNRSDAAVNADAKAKAAEIEATLEARVSAARAEERSRAARSLAVGVVVGAVGAIALGVLTAYAGAPTK